MGMNLYSISVNCRLKWFIFSGVGSREDVVIHLGSSTEVGLLFEVENLSVASPATVSRAGMIYLDINDLGWESYA